MECYMFVILTVTFNSKKLFLHLGKKLWPGNEGKDTFWLDQVLTPFLHIPVSICVIKLNPTSFQENHLHSRRKRIL